MAVERDTDRSFWFVGAIFGINRDKDQTDRFVEEGIWEHDFDNPDDLAKVQPKVRSIQPGDRIAIKSNYTQKRNLPFDYGNKHVSGMYIKAVGTVLENMGDGQRVRVDWQRFDTPRRWYFYTMRPTIRQVLSGENWKANALIAFAFDGEEQDYNRFLAEYRTDDAANKGTPSWVPFYEEVADKILGYKDNRKEFTAGIHELSENLETPPALQDFYPDGRRGPLEDICPFTVMGLFNHGMTDSNRQARADELAIFLKVQADPKISPSVPVLQPLSIWFFRYAKDRRPQDIGLLWELFDKAIAFAASDTPESRTAFAEAYDEAMECAGVKWNITMALLWIRPRNFVSLDAKSRPYIGKVLDIEVPKEPYSGEGYLNILDSLKERFEDTTVAVNSFIDVAKEAWKHDLERRKAKDSEDEPPPEPDDPDIEPTPPATPYTLDNILNDGCFIEPERLDQILRSWGDKHNLILQGPPGTGKTWLAKRLAYALMGEKSTNRVRSVQFHPNLSYEDFVRGWRPDEEGRLALMDGPFIEMMGMAKKDPDKQYVVVIEEVNRGEPAKIFGELLTLLESDKRTPEEALELTYRHPHTGPEYIPDNLYVIGTMNIADRSLALVDLALRRRFDFVDLEPTFNTSWQEWVQAKYEESDYEIDAKTIDKIGQRIKELNENIEADSSLGKQFRIGHSYVTPPKTPTTDVREWFLSVVNYKIGPLLEEYWFDNLEKAANAKKNLLKDF